MIAFSPECYLCILRQSLTAARAAEADDDMARAVIRSSLKILLDADPRMPMMAALDPVWRAAVEILDDPDPFTDLKAANIDSVLERYEAFMAVISEAADPFETAVRLAIAGNIIDIAAGIPTDIWEPIEAVMRAPFAVDDLALLRAAVKDAEDILYLCDNAGEAVFDRMLIETMGKNVTFVVKAAPVINDATRRDAERAGIDRVAAIIDNGSPGVGTQLHKCSESFLERFASADLIISKGMANYESLTELADPRLFFLLKAKCAAVSRLLSVPEGGIVLKRSDS